MLPEYKPDALVLSVTYFRDLILQDIHLFQDGNKNPIPLTAEHFEREPKLRENLDKAFAALVMEKRRWQFESPIDRRIAFERLVEAQGYGDALLQLGCRIPDQKVELVLISLFAGFWKDFGHLRWHARKTP